MFCNSKELDQLFDARAVRQLLLLSQTPVDERRQHAGPHVDVPPEHDVVQHGQAGEQGDVLKRARDSKCGDLRWSRLSDVSTFQCDRAAGRTIKPRNQVEQRCLARTVRTDDRQMISPRPDGHRHVLNSTHAHQGTISTRWL